MRIGKSAAWAMEAPSRLRPQIGGQSHRCAWFNEAADPNSTDPAAHARDVIHTEAADMVRAETAPVAPGLCAGYRGSSSQERAPGQNHRQAFQHGDSFCVRGLIRGEVTNRLEISVLLRV
jgi:hypothetical protein